jgi:hypothetical protein
MEREMNTHKHYEAAKRAYNNTSFSPEKRAQNECSFFDEIITEFEGKEYAQTKFETLFLASLAAKSRCASVMIAGGANFPTERNRKANESERKKSQAMFDFIEKVRKSNEPKVEYFVKSNDVNVIEKIQAELDAAKESHAKLKALPTEERNWYELPYALNKVKRIEERLTSIAELKSRTNKEKMFGDVKVVWNYDAMRLQFIFDGKPSSDMIAKLKKAAFKWSPTNGAWQRQLTRNAEIAAGQLLNTTGA